MDDLNDQLAEIVVDAINQALAPVLQRLAVAERAAAGISDAAEAAARDLIEQRREILRGPAGRDGELPAVEQWRPGEYRRGAVVSWRGATWQARSVTIEQPGKTAAWQVVANGIAGATIEDGDLYLMLSDGARLNAGPVRGPAGYGFTFRNLFSSDETYNARDVVTANGATWLCLEDGTRTRPPGAAWALLAKQGRTGARGERGPGPSEQEIAAAVDRVLTEQFDDLAAAAAARVEPGPRGPRGPAGIIWRGAFDFKDTYAAGDLVRHGGAVFICTGDTAGQAPAAGGDGWDLFLAAPPVGE